MTAARRGRRRSSSTTTSTRSTSSSRTSRWRPTARSASTSTTAGSAEAASAGLALDPASPYGATNYCVNTSVQFYRPDLTPKGHNIRLSLHTWDPQLNAPFRFCVCSPNATFLGDYFGNTFSGSTSIATSISTFDDGTNPRHYQQQVVATVSIP